MGIRAVLAGLGLLLPPGSFSGKWFALCCGCYFPVDLVSTDKCILLVALDRNDTYRTGHLEHIVGVVRGCHELGKRWAAEYPIVGQWEISNIKCDSLCPEIQLAAKRHWQCDLPLWLALPGLIP